MSESKLHNDVDGLKRTIQLVYTIRIRLTIHAYIDVKD